LIKVGYGKLIICRGSRDELTLEAHTLQSVKRAIKSGMKTGIKAFCFLVLDYMKAGQTNTPNKGQQKSF